MNRARAVRPYPILAVLGASHASEEDAAVAARVGACAAKAGWVVLTGGGPGVMEAASRGAVEAGGITVGILPTSCPGGAYPNAWVQIPIHTGSGSARNAFNVLSADLCVAIGGGSGTLSEIALALKSEKPVWCFRSWGLSTPPGTDHPLPKVFDDGDQLIDALEAELSQRISEDC